MGWKRAGTLGAALAVLLAPAAGRADVSVGLGANYWIEQGGLFSLDIGVRTALARQLLVGGRFGAFLTTQEKVGIPLDLTLTIPIAKRRVYIEALGGPWLSFEGDFVRAHAAFGFGLQSGDLRAGIEAGWLSPAGILGAHLSWRI